jgi:DNA-binding transcriptional ArsR family regulator
MDTDSEISMSDRSLAELEEFFLALSDGTRLRLLNLMRQGEVSVGYLSERLGQSQPKISRHLAYLRSAGLVETRRDGKWIYYHISEPASPFAAGLLDAALDWAVNPDGQVTARKTFAYLESNDERVLGDLDDDLDGPYSNDLEIYLL